ncbi:zinc finger protein with KRAB and SCAN domains 1-like [Osmerus eperlanus]|uniref:zinc finger protein with KRAB and SCAN domains 1-like n=1 Tax=Osmerus eperlanus TaxID=29151 RepID=UPI002E152B44
MGGSNPPTRHRRRQLVASTCLTGEANRPRVCVQGLWYVFACVYACEMTMKRELASFIAERLTVAAVEIIGAVAKTISEYKEETERLKNENTRLLSLLKGGQIKSELDAIVTEVAVEPAQPDPKIRTTEDEGPFRQQDSDNNNIILIPIGEPSESAHFKEDPPQPSRSCFYQVINIQDGTLLDSQLKTSAVCGDRDESEGGDIAGGLQSILRHLGSNGTEKRETQHTCICTKDKESEQTLEEMDVQTEEQRRTEAFCKDCNLKDDSKDATKQVEARELSNGSYRCTECGKSFPNNDKFTIHMSMHTEEKPFPCTECGKCFQTRGCLTVHKKIHTGEKLFQCEKCDKCFNRKDHLVSHFKVHQRENTYFCTECGKSFKFKGRLTSHMKIHTGEKPFPCKECDKCFNRKEHLVYHSKVHLRGKKLFGTDCG